MCAVQKYSVNESLKVGTDFSKGLRRLDVRRPSRPRVTMAVQWRKKNYTINFESPKSKRYDISYYTYLYVVVGVGTRRACRRRRGKCRGNRDNVS